MMWKGMTPELLSPLLKAGLSSVCQSPAGMKQNCSEPDSRMLLSTPDRTSSSRHPWICDQLFWLSGQRRRSLAVVHPRRSPIRATTEDITMATETDKLVILLTKGIDTELSSVAFTIANGGLTSGLKVSMFLTSTAIDLVRRGGHKLTQVAPLQPLAALIEDFQKRGGTIWACPPCVQSRGYEQADLLDGVIIVGASAMHAEIKQGAATLSF